MASATVSASILGGDLANLAQSVRTAVDAGCDEIHFDVMDGHFVDNISMGLILFEAIRPLAPLPFEAHMMVSDPAKFIEGYAAAGCELYTVHHEACGDRAAEMADRIHAAGMRAGLALNPETPAAAADHLLDRFDRVLVMTVSPGASGQPFLEGMMPKLGHLRDTRRGGVPELAVDGGIKVGTAPAARRAGAEVLVSATGIFNHAEGARAAVDALRAAS